MSRDTLTVSLETVRRLTVTKQHLAGKLPVRAEPSAILSVVRDLAYVQWDPVTIVAPSHILSLWNRLGDFRLSDWDRLLLEEKKLFQHWTPIASVVLTEDFPLYHSLMQRYPESMGRSWGRQGEQARLFLAAHRDLRTKLIDALRTGPLQIGEFKEHTRTKRNDGEWTLSSDVSLMLFHLMMSGEVMVVGHRGTQNVWGLAKEFLPHWVQRTELTPEEVEREAAQRAIRALGTATPSEINYHFIRGRYQTLRATLDRLEAEGRIHRVEAEGLVGREVRYVHDLDVHLLESMPTADWYSRISLLPPFDNLISSSARTSRLFGFRYVREQFLPREKRRFGTYVLPILWGEKLIGRIDPRMDRESGTLVINSVHSEPGAPAERAVAVQIRDTIGRLAAFLGARGVSYSSRVPVPWKGALHGADPIRRRT